MWISYALVAQPDRASDYESEGRRFESCRARHSNSSICRSFCCNSALRAANLFGSDRNVTGVGSPVGPFEAPKSGSPRPALRWTLAICEQKGWICPSPSFRRGADRGSCHLPSMLKRTCELLPLSQNDPFHNCKFFAGRLFLRVVDRDQPARSPNGLCRAPNRCDVLRGQMAKVERRGCMESGSLRVFRYSSTHEKVLPSGSIRRRSALGTTGNQWCQPVARRPGLLLGSARRRVATRRGL